TSVSDVSACPDGTSSGITSFVSREADVTTAGAVGATASLVTGDVTGTPAGAAPTSVESTPGSTSFCAWATNATQVRMARATGTERRMAGKTQEVTRTGERRNMRIQS